MSPSRRRSARLPRTLLAACFVLSSLPGPLLAAPKTFGQADAAWHKGELEQAMALYEEALAKGGLEPAEVVLAYARIGTVQGALGDENAALSAFRTAAMLDPAFELPADAGPVAKKLHARARAEAEKNDEYLSLSLSVPEEVPARQPFSVVVVMPPNPAALVNEVVLTVDDGSGKAWRQTLESAPELTFEVPAKVAKSGARLVLVARALDGRKNAWAMAEAKVAVEGAPVPAAGSMVDEEEKTPFEEEKARERSPKRDSEGGFFSGSTPWILGGAAAAVVTGVALFFALQPTDDVRVGAPSWQR